jgi:ketosteroid isomerase-like protein
MDTEGRWIDDLLAAIDQKDHAAFTSFLLPDARFRYGNSLPVQGRTAIAETVAGFFSALKSLKHKIEDRWVLPNVAIITGIVTYTRHDGSTLKVPFSNVLKLSPAGIHEYLIFIDSSALFVV